MYHYVRESRPDLPYFRYLDVGDFQKQLDWLDAQYGFVSREEFLAAFDSGDPPTGAVLTFDDGLIDHRESVLPALLERGLWGIFYVPAGPHLDGRPLDVHKTHCLLGRFGGAAVLETLLEVLDPAMLVPEWVELLRTRTYLSQSNDEATLAVKQALNYFTKIEERTAVVEAVEARLDSPISFADVYLDSEGLRCLTEAGMLLGSHSVTHRPMSQLPVEGQEWEIRTAFDVLEDVAGRQEVRTFCYPYGGFESFTQDTERLLTEAGCRFSFNVEAREVSRSDLVHRPQALPRFDCNQFPHGKAKG